MREEKTVDMLEASQRCRDEARRIRGGYAMSQEGERGKRSGDVRSKEGV
jgi:hypothetical protein